VETAFGDGQKRDGLASHSAKQSVGVAREPDRNADACFGPRQQELQARPGIVGSISGKLLGVGVKTDRHQEGICDSRPEDIIFRSYSGYRGRRY
jgi:hypothetical protein